MSKMCPQVFNSNLEKKVTSCTSELSCVHKCFLTGPILMLSHSLQGLQLFYLACLFFSPHLQTKDVALQKQWCNKFACFSSSFQIIMLIAGHFDRMQDVTSAALRLHLLIDHQPCRIKRECQGRWAHTTQSWGEHCLAGGTLHHWDSIMMTHLY